MTTIDPELFFKVSQGAEYSVKHDHWYYGGSQHYFVDGTKRQFFSMSGSCLCGEPLYDGEPICGPRYERENWEVVHVNCCTEHDHDDDDD